MPNKLFPNLNNGSVRSQNSLPPSYNQVMSNNASSNLTRVNHNNGDRFDVHSMGKSDGGGYLYKVETCTGTSTSPSLTVLKRNDKPVSSSQSIEIKVAAATIAHLTRR